MRLTKDFLFVFLSSSSASDPEGFLPSPEMKARFLSLSIVQGFIYHIAAEYGTRVAEFTELVQVFSPLLWRPLCRTLFGAVMESNHIRFNPTLMI